nr:hypothetical protein [uncultured Brevundimonas sp.]
MQSPPANDDDRTRPHQPYAMEQPAASHWSGRMTVGVLAGLSLLLWALIAGGVYMVVRILL